MSWLFMIKRIFYKLYYFKKYIKIKYSQTRLFIYRFLIITEFIYILFLLGVL